MYVEESEQGQLTPEQIKEIKVKYVMLLSKLEYFVRYMFKAQYKRRWAQWPHLLKIIEVLEMVLDGKITRLMIHIAPRYGKTELAVKAFIAYCLALCSSAKFIHLSYSATLAEDNSEAAKDLVQSAEYQQLFPYVQITKSSKGKRKWYTTDKGGVYATSSGGQITGFGAGQTDDFEGLAESLEELLTDDDLVGDFSAFEDIDDLIGEIEELDRTYNKKDWLGERANFAGAIIIDDPNKPDDADSEVLRNKVNERYDSTISNRVNSPRTPIIIIQQRTHEQDLSGYLLEKQGRIEDGGKWFVLSLPSIQEDGTALCPAKHSVEDLRELEQQNSVVFQRQHMQNPKPRAGLLFPIDDLHFFDMDEMRPYLKDPDFIFLPADPAGEGGDDFAGAPFVLIGDKIFIPEVLYNTDGADINEFRFLDLILKYDPEDVGVEGVLGWKETANRIRNAAVEKGFEKNFRILKPRTNKHVRITNRASFIRNHFYFRKDWQDFPQYAKFMRCLTSYLKIQEIGKGNKHDDAPDLCEMAAKFYEISFPHLWGVGKNK